MHRPVGLTSIALIALCLAGCTHWIKPGASQQEADAAFFAECMTQLGWTRLHSY